MTPSLVAPDDTMVLFDGTGTYTIETANIAMAGVYTIDVVALTYQGTPTTIGFTWELTVIDPCVAATLTIDPTVFPSPYEYIITQTADVQTIVDTTHVSSSETLAVCPDIIFEVW